MDNFERRISCIEFELRAGKNNEKVIEGTAVRYNRLSGPIQSKSGATFRERIMPGAFRNVLQSNPDVVMLQDHEPSKILGRTTAGTLRLQDTAKGLQFRCSMPNTQLGNDLHTSIARGDINACSFAFNLGSDRDADLSDMDEDDFDENGEERAAKKKLGKHLIVRTVRNIAQLHDISVVTYPAYPTGTSVSARSAAIVVPTLEVHIPDSARRDESSSSRQRRIDLLKTILS
jgi:uncharacterized protein